MQDSTVPLYLVHLIKLIFMIMLTIFSVEVAAQTYFLNGTATAGEGDCYQLTTAQGEQNGNVWYGEQIDLNLPFELNFSMNFGNIDATGADGMVFVLQNVGTDAFGETGGALGFSGDDFDPSFGIEFDTWQNGQYGDLITDHIGFVSDGSVDHAPPTGLAGPVNANINGMNIEDGEDHPVRITWDPNTSIVAVYFDCEFRLAQEVNLIEDIFDGQTSVYWGFTGSTGGSFNSQAVCLAPNIIATDPLVAVCPGGSLELNVSGAPNATYTWEPADFLEDPNAATTLCTPDSSMTYVVSYEGFCNATVSDTIEVVVEELEAQFTTDPSNVLTCITTVINLQATSNFPSGVGFTWESGDANNNFQSNQSSTSTDEAGNYWLIANFNDGACMDSLAFVIELDTLTYQSSLISDFSTINCAVDTVMIQLLTGGNDALFEWSQPDGADYVWTNEPFELLTTTPGTWEVQTTNPGNGCTSTAEIILDADFTFPDVEAGYADTLTCSNPSSPIYEVGSTPLDYTSQLSWSWEQGALNALDPYAPIALAPGTYFLTVLLTENGCSGQDSVIVFQDPEATIDASSARFPNVISPNRDGYNERLTLYLEDFPEFPLLSIVQDFKLSIFNRWGNLVYSSQGSPVEWDGRLNDEDVAEGFYYYKVEYLIVCGEEQRGTISGGFELFR